uniref:Uncharacterized protein n=1 Tax=Hyaloperonospora arabidopsidis (strain Emoy2) TaxID=559515 RepID=M4BKK4_HYAAE
MHSDQSCPHEACLWDVTATLQYVVWECSIAKAAWAGFGIRWQRLRDNMMDNLRDLCFSLALVDTPARKWLVVRDRVDAVGDAVRDDMLEVSRSLWRLTVASTIHDISCSRLRLRHEPDALYRHCGRWLALQSTSLCAIFLRTSSTQMCPLFRRRQ